MLSKNKGLAIRKTQIFLFIFVLVFTSNCALKNGKSGNNLINETNTESSEKSGEGIEKVLKYPLYIIVGLPRDIIDLPLVLTGNLLLWIGGVGVEANKGEGAFASGLDPMTGGFTAGLGGVPCIVAGYGVGYPILGLDWLLCRSLTNECTVAYDNPRCKLKLFPNYRAIFEE